VVMSKRHQPRLKSSNFRTLRKYTGSRLTASTGVANGGASGSSSWHTDVARRRPSYATIAGG